MATATALDDGRVVHDEVVGVCPKSECGGDLVPVTGWGAWTDERCTRCDCSWCYQEPREIGDISVAAERERARRAAYCDTADALAILDGMTDEQLDAYLRGRALRRAAVASRGVGAPFDPDACFGKELRVYPKEDL